MENQKNKFWKFTLLFFATIVGVFILYLAGAWGWYFLQQWQGQKAVQQLAENLERVKKENYERAMADTYGGKIPQETLQMYISAVEKGDYELASKYFIEKYQEEELESSYQLTTKEMENYISLLKIAITKNGYFSSDNMPGMKEFFIDKPIYIRIGLYPNGIWKIVKI
ncbi:MAG: hypothetical protein AAB504_03355 [Patescibacteria group bacterium]